MAAAVAIPERMMAQVATTAGATAKVKRFYEKVDVVTDEAGKFNVTLDGRRIKTPSGTPVSLTSEKLALLVAQEWDDQHEHIKASHMHITGLVNTAADNPSNRTHAEQADELLAYLETDTVTFRDDSVDSFYKMQLETWGPIHEWFEKRHGVRIETTLSLSPPHLTESTMTALKAYMLVLPPAAMAGFEMAVTTAKSFIIAQALIDGYITTEQAAHAARLETVFQTDRFGEVEWAHTLERHDTTARLAAAALYIRSTLRDD